jgi:hypothetical protein
LIAGGFVQNWPVAAATIARNPSQNPPSPTSAVEIDRSRIAATDRGPGAVQANLDANDPRMCGSSLSLSPASDGGTMASIKCGPGADNACSNACTKPSVSVARTACDPPLRRSR